MKNYVLLIILSLFLGACSVTNNYYQAFIQTDSPVYSRNKGSSPIGRLNKGDYVYIDTTYYKSGYKKIMFNGRPAWIYSPSDNVKYTFNKPATTNAFPSQSSSSKKHSNSSSRSYTPTSSSGGRVNVKGYYRKNGTYVRPHTRSVPRRR